MKFQREIAILLACMVAVQPALVASLPNLDPPFGRRAQLSTADVGLPSCRLCRGCVAEEAYIG